MRRLHLLLLTSLAAALLTIGCGPPPGPCTSVQRIDPNAQVDLSGNWNDTDANQVAKAMIHDCLSRPWAAKFKAEKGRDPVVRLYADQEPLLRAHQLALLHQAGGDGADQLGHGQGRLGLRRGPDQALRARRPGDRTPPTRRSRPRAGDGQRLHAQRLDRAPRTTRWTARRCGPT